MKGFGTRLVVGEHRSAEHVAEGGPGCFFRNRTTIAVVLSTSEETHRAAVMKMLSLLNSLRVSTSGRRACELGVSTAAAVPSTPVPSDVLNGRTSGNYRRQRSKIV